MKLQATCKYEKFLHLSKFEQSAFNIRKLFALKQIRANLVQKFAK